MKKIVTLLIISLLAFVACDKIESTDPSAGNEPGILSFNADILTTKTTFSSNKTLWNHDDVITVYNGAAASDFTNDLGSGTGASATYSGTLASAAEYWAMYPVPESNVYGFTSDEWTATRSWTATGPVYTVPASQTAVTNGIQEGLDVIVASTTSASMSFIHSCATLKFTIGPSSPAITEIKVEGAKIAGNYRHIISSGNQESYSGSSGAITLAMGGSAFPVGDYYIVIAVRNYTSGLSFKFTRSDGKIANVVKSTTFTPIAGHVYPMGTIPNDLTFKTVPIIGSAYEGGICAYVGAEYAYALSLDQGTSLSYTDAETWVSNKGGTWVMPTQDEFTQIRTAISGASYTASSKTQFDIFNTQIEGLSGTALSASDGYWTSTPGSTDAKEMAFKYFNNAITAYGSAQDSNKTSSRPVRAIKRIAL